MTNNSEIEIGEDVKKVLYSQVIKPELARVSNFYSTVRETNIKGYDFGATIFWFMPEVNSIIDKKTGKSILSLMAHNPVIYDMEWVEANFMTEMTDILKNYVKESSKVKVGEWTEHEFLEAKDGVVMASNFLNTKYLDKFAGNSMNEVASYAANDFVINSLLANANTHMLIAGDPAQYSQDKAKGHFKNGKSYLPKSPDSYAKVSEGILGVNLGKRLALLQAPGNKYAGSMAENYIQIALNDHMDITTNVGTLVGIFYGEDKVKSAEALVKKLNDETDSSRRKALIETLEEKYPRLKDYFNIESTDAQEYTTISEHLNVMWKEGSIEDDVHAAMLAKVKVQLESEKKGTAIPDSAMLNYNELKLVFQPIKPVYTGVKDEPRFDTMRIMYIKSSSFPLLPQVTKGTELDGLRRMLETHEEKTGKFVRASYQTANKVGANTNALTIFNNDGTFNNEITEEQVEASSLVLDRKNFRVQQKVPFKSGSRSADTVSMVTQVLKLLFGDGVTNISGFKYKGAEYTGDELRDIYNSSMVNYVKKIKDILYKRLGMDVTGKPKNAKRTMKLLQKLLKEEALSRGYSQQDIESLDLVPILNSKGEILDHKFKIPIWLSTNSNKFEAMLNSIVTNKLVNLKLPGNSYVLGTEAGFKMTDSLEGIDQNRIIYSKKFKGSLQAYNGGDLAQVFLPSKFRDNEGKLIEFFDKEGLPNPTYVERDEQGVLRLKEGMISEELMRLTSMRIPNSGHVSMSQMEIAGILPTEVGDLMILPKNFIVQKGIDFDVDKEFTYHLHTYVDSEGRVKVLTEEAKEDSAISEDEFDKKLLENDIVMAHSSVLSNTSPEMQAKINRVLSMDFAKSQAEEIDKIVSVNKKGTFSILSDTYQKTKMSLGAAGKLGIGVYSNEVVFIGLVTQSKTDIALTEEDAEGHLVSSTMDIGTQRSDGNLSSIHTLAPRHLRRTRAEVAAEAQNTATDNEKEQIMAKVNLNSITISAHSALIGRGFDKDELRGGAEVSIPYYLLSQPIIIEYVEKMKALGSQTKVYDPLGKEKVVKELLLGYHSDNNDVERQELTGDNLHAQLSGEVTPEFQRTVLNLFLDLDAEGKEKAALQRRLNIGSGGLGKSFFDVIDKRDWIESLRNPTGGNIRNIQSLVGEFKGIEKEGLSKDLIDEGYVSFGEFAVKPTTPGGVMLVESVQAGYDLWKDVFPYNSPGVRRVTEEIGGQVLNEETSPGRKIVVYQRIFKEIKRYLNSSDKLGVFYGNAQENRKELFIDSSENTSLASYLREVTKDGSDVAQSLRNNRLISRFQYKLNGVGGHSLIVFDNTKSENFDEEYLSNSLLELMGEDTTLPDYNGEPFSTKKLALKLIAYSYLEGGVQEAVQFSKYIPVSYLNTINFGRIVRNWDEQLIPGIFHKLLGTSTRKDVHSVFTKQYMQHNPGSAYKIDPEKDIFEQEYLEGEKNVLENLQSFESDPKEEDTILFDDRSYVAIYNQDISKGHNKFQLYVAVGKRYERIPVLGTFGLAEYQIREENANTLINKKEAPLKKSIKVANVVPNIISNPLGVRTQNVPTILEAIAKTKFSSNNNNLSNLAKVITPFVPAGLKIVVTDTKALTGVKASGVHRESSNTVYLDSTFVDRANPEAVARVFLHEVIHALTRTYVKKYVAGDGSYIGKPPQAIVELVRLFNETKRKLSDELVKYGQKSPAERSSRDLKVVYGGTSIYEFLTLVLTEKAFQEEMKDTPFRATERSLFYKFVEVVDSMLRNIFGENYKKGNVASEGVRVALEIVKNQYKENALRAPNSSLYDSMERADSSAENLLTGVAEPSTNLDDIGVVVPKDAPTNLDDIGVVIPKDAPTNLDDIGVVIPKDADSDDDPYIATYESGKPIPVVEILAEYDDGVFTKAERDGVSIFISEPSETDAKKVGLHFYSGFFYKVSFYTGAPINISTLLDKGKTVEDILGNTTNANLSDIKDQGLKDWYEGKNMRSVFFIEFIGNFVDEFKC